MSKIGGNNAQVAAIKNQYMEAQKNHDTTKMNKLKQQGMKLMNEIEKSEKSEKQDIEPGIKNKDGDLLKISNEGLSTQNKAVENEKLED